MQIEQPFTIGEMLRITMRQWVTGVAVVTTRSGEHSHGMTVNSFVSVSLEPPMVTVTMADESRTFQLVREAGVFGVTILSDVQVALAERFAGRGPEPPDRMAGLDLFTMVSGAPLIRGGVAYIDCRVAQMIPISHSTLVLGEVLATRPANTGTEGARPPLVYYNRAFSRLD